MPPEDAQPTGAQIPDIEDLADSDDPMVIEARAKLLKAQSQLVRAHTPILDKLILRGLIPFVLAIVGPMTAWHFSTKTEEVNQKAGNAMHAAEASHDAADKLRKLLAGEKIEADRQRKRFARLEEQKAEELAAMAAMVIRLDSTLKTAMVQLAVATEFNDRVTDAQDPDRDEIVESISAQMNLPGLESQELQRLAGQAYDRHLMGRPRK